MPQEKITPAYLRGIVRKIISEVESMGCTQIQLVHEAGIKHDRISKMKNPTINTIIKLMEARDRLKTKMGK